MVFNGLARQAAEGMFEAELRASAERALIRRTPKQAFNSHHNVRREI
jgi:hypothetical protein